MQQSFWPEDSDKDANEDADTGSHVLHMDIEEGADADMPGAATGTVMPDAGAPIDEVAGSGTGVGAGIYTTQDQQIIHHQNEGSDADAGAGIGLARGVSANTGMDGATAGIAEWSRTVFDAVLDNVLSVFYGRERPVRLAMCCLAAGGHLLVEDLPGVGKTTLAKALANSLAVSFRRVQGTADLMPSDITGTIIFDRNSSQLNFRPGPIFTNILLVDELNRASPRAQSALLEAMEEGHVTVDGVSYTLPHPFLLIATQNPYDNFGTYDLPISQRDRFLVRISLGYLDRGIADTLLASNATMPHLDSLRAVASPDVIVRLKQAITQVHMSPEIRGYILDLAEASRSNANVQIGASSRAFLSLARVSQAYALSFGRLYVTPDDIKSVAPEALAHRIVLAPAAEMAGISAESVVLELLEQLPVPAIPSGRHGSASRQTEG